MITTDAQMITDDSSVCTLNCKDKALRLEALRQEVFQYHYRIEEDLNTIRLIFTNNQPSEATLKRFIALEGQCCNFLTLTLASQENSDNIVTIQCPEQDKSQLREWLKQLSQGVIHTTDETSVLSSLGSFKKMRLAIMSLSMIGLLCCVSPFIVVGLAGLGFSFSLPTMAQTTDNIFIGLSVLLVIVVGVIFLLPKFLRRTQCSDTRKR